MLSPLEDEEVPCCCYLPHLLQRSLRMHRRTSERQRFPSKRVAQQQDMKSRDADRSKRRASSTTVIAACSLCAVVSAQLTGLTGGGKRARGGGGMHGEGPGPEGQRERLADTRTTHITLGNKQQFR